MTTRAVPPWEEDRARRAATLAGRNVSEITTVFEFLNDTLARPIGLCTSFQLFPKLPLELREHIWMLSLPEHRLIKVTVAAADQVYDSTYHSRNDRSNDTNPAPYESKNELENIVSGANYRLHLGSTITHSPLLFVNHEANAAVHRTYRVRIPMTQRVPNADAPRLRFCPERDTILIAVEREEDTAYFADFVHDAMAYDPEKKGILHMAIMDRSAEHIHLPVGKSTAFIRLPELHSRAQASLAHTLRGLKSVSLVHLYYTKSREMFNSILQHVLNHEISPPEKVRFNRAYPLWSKTASYSILPADPRPVSRHLELVDCGRDPWRLIRAWRMFEAAYDVLLSSLEKMRVIIATADSDECLTIANVSQARRFRQQEEFMWRCHWEKGQIFNRWYPEMSNPDNSHDLEFSRTQNAIGFWSIPVEAFGPVPELPEDFYKWKMSRLCNFTAFESQIQLGLFDLE